MYVLNKFTTQSDLTEDRIRLSGTIDNDQTLQLWLTQRLVNRLVSHLCQILEKPVSLNSKTPPPIRGYSQRTRLEQSFAQQQARVTLPKQPPVVPSADSPQWRVDHVDIQHAKSGVRLIFKGATETQQVMVSLPTSALRQWLGILYGQCLRAEWPLQAWPSWMADAGQQNPSSPTDVLH